MQRCYFARNIKEKICQHKNSISTNVAMKYEFHERYLNLIQLQLIMKYLGVNKHYDAFGNKIA